MVQRSDQSSGHSTIKWQAVFSRLCILLALTCGIGCTGNSKNRLHVAVRGEVTLDGDPLPAGIIKFIPAGATKGQVTILPIKQGKYESAASTGPCLGDYRVEIEQIVDEQLAKKAVNPKAFLQYLKTQGSHPPIPTLPDRYNRQSTLTARITSAAQRIFDFELISTNTDMASQ